MPLLLLGGTSVYLLSLDLAVPRKAHSPEARVEYFLDRCGRFNKRTELINKYFRSLLSNDWLNEFEDARTFLVFRQHLTGDPTIIASGSVHRVGHEWFGQLNGRSSATEKIIHKDVLPDGRVILETMKTNMAYHHCEYLYTLAKEKGDWKFERSVVESRSRSKQAFLLSEVEQEEFRSYAHQKKAFGSIPETHHPRLEDLFNTSPKECPNKQALTINRRSIVFGSELMGIHSDDLNQSIHLFERVVPKGKFPVDFLENHNGVYAARIYFSEEIKAVTYVKAQRYQVARDREVLEIDHHLRGGYVQFLEFAKVCSTPLREFEIRRAQMRDRDSDHGLALLRFSMPGDIFLYWGLNERQEIVSLTLDGYSHWMSRNAETVKVVLSSGWLDKPIEHPVFAKYGMEVRFRKNSSGDSEMVYTNRRPYFGEIFRFAIVDQSGEIVTDKLTIGKNMRKFRRFGGQTTTHFAMPLDNGGARVYFHVITGFGAE